MDAVKTGMLIAQVRKERGLTQKNLAESLHVSIQAVSKWERGLNCPDIALLEPLAEALGLTVTELLSGRRGEEPKEELVRSSLRFGLKQMGPKVRRWKWLFLCAAALLLTLAAGQGYAWLRDNTELLPQLETVVRGLNATERETVLAQAAGKALSHLYQVDFADGVTSCSFRWELWTQQGLEKSWEAGEQERYQTERHQIIAVTLLNPQQDPRFRYGIGLESPGGEVRLGLDGTLDGLPQIDVLGFSFLTQRTAVDPEEGVVLLALTLSQDGRFPPGGFADLSSGGMDLPPESDTAVWVLLRMYCC